MRGTNAYFSAQDLYESIEKGEHPSWTWNIQVIPEAEAENYKWDVYDATKVWPHSEVPLIPVGRLVLDKTCDDYFKEVE